MSSNTAECAIHIILNVHRRKIEQNTSKNPQQHTFHTIHNRLPHTASALQYTLPPSRRSLSVLRDDYPTLLSLPTPAPTLSTPTGSADATPPSFLLGDDDRTDIIPIMAQAHEQPRHPDLPLVTIALEVVSLAITVRVPQVGFGVYVVEVDGFPVEVWGEGGGGVGGARGWSS